MNNFHSPPQLQQAVNQSGASIHRRRQQLVQIGVKLREQLWVHAEQAEMSADALQRTELASRDQALLDLAVARRKEHVVTDRHHVGLCLDTAERRYEISAGVAAYVASLPLPRHRQQILWVPRREG